MKDPEAKKRCRDCGKLKPLSGYYVHSQMGDGYLNKCKECVKTRVGKHRDANLERIKEYDRNRPNHAQRIREKTIREKTLYHSDPEYRDKILEQKSRWRERNHVKRAAHTITGNAIRDGRLIRKSCEVCGKKKAHAHHEDYYYPMNVKWLCPKHHMERHREINAMKRDGKDLSHKGF